MRNGATLMGFPAFKNGTTYPTLTNYFATFPAAIATNTKTFKYIGRELGSANPLQIFSVLSEPLDRTQAYWFSAETGETFYGPPEFSLTNARGMMTVYSTPTGHFSQPGKM